MKLVKLLQVFLSLKDLETTLNGSAIVGGSTRLYGSGIINGVPHDLELLTTKSRLGAVQKSIGKKGSQYGPSNGFKQSLEGNNKVFNSDGNRCLDYWRRCYRIVSS